MTGWCFGSADFREALDQEKIRVGDIVEDRIQPSSYEPVITSKCYVLDSESGGVFRPSDRRKVSNSLKKLSLDRYIEVDISEGYELKRGFTYLFPLAESVRLDDGEFLKSSPKSSLGRLFLNTRLIADYNLGFDEIHPYDEKHLDLYLLVQPLVFNVVVHPGIALNQIRLFNGIGAKLTPSEVVERQDSEPFLFRRFGSSPRPSNLRVSDSVGLHLDLLGFGDGDVIGLRARRNPIPIDLSRKGAYDLYRYFEPLHADEKRFEIKSKEYYLFASKEVFRMPDDLNAEAYQHSSTGISGPLHFAGFIDNGFNGYLVFEVRSDELSNMVIYDGMPISKVDFFRTGDVKKVYGEDIGSHYQGQEGPRVAKYFKPVQF